MIDSKDAMSFGERQQYHRASNAPCVPTRNRATSFLPRADFIHGAVWAACGTSFDTACELVSMGELAPDGRLVWSSSGGGSFFDGLLELGQGSIHGVCCKI